MADDLSWIDHPANLRANAALLRAIAEQSLLHADEIERLTERNTEHEARYSALEALEQIRRDEIERLREALQCIHEHAIMGHDDAADGFIKIAGMVRDALNIQQQPMGEHD